jgi:hypothetical protein
MIDHVNYQVPTDVVHTREMTEFWDLLRLQEVEPTEALDKQYVVRWWEDPGTGFRVHIVGANEPPLYMGLGHLCVAVSDGVWEACAKSRWMARYNPDSPMRRVWLLGPGDLRVEVQRRA